jgi:hypothetical protein
MKEPTRVWGNLGNISAAGAGVVTTTVPGPWGPIIGAVLGLLSLIFTEINRSQVSPKAST